MSKFIREMQEKRAAVVAKMTGMNEAAQKEDRGFTNEERTQWDSLVAEENDLKTRIEDAEKVEGLSRGLKMPAGTNFGGNDKQDNKELEHREVFNKWMKRGFSGLTAAEQKLMEEKRAMGWQQGDNVTAEHLIPEDLQNKILEARKAFGGIRSISNVIRTSTGNPLSYPTANTTEEVATLFGENAAIPELDTSFGYKSLGAYKFGTMLRASVELLNDAPENLNAYFGRLLGRRLARGESAYFVNGKGASDSQPQPEGILVGGKNSGVTLAANPTAADGYWQAMLKLKHSLDPAYRMGCHWVFNDKTLLGLKSQIDSQGRPIWVPGYTASEPALIDGDRYVIDQAMPEIAAGAKAIAYGDFSQYMIRDVAGIVMQRLTERYAELGQVGFLTYARTDARVMDQNAIQYLTVAASKK